VEFITQYANEELWEKEWQKEYKYGVILFIPPEAIFSVVNELRQKHDKLSADGCCAHISLTMPIKNPLTIKDVNEIKRKLSHFERFEVHYGPFINFLPVAKGVVLEIEEQKKFEELYKTIENAEGVEFYHRKWPFKAHMTIAEFISEEDTVILTEELNKNTIQGSFSCDKVYYMVPNQDMVFEKIIEFDLA
jgi:2'-5' RNA ligase